MGLRRHQVLQVQRLPRPRLPCPRFRHRLRLREHGPPLRLKHTRMLSLLLGLDLVLVRLAPPLRLLPPLVPIHLERTCSPKRLVLPLALRLLLVLLLVRLAPLRHHGGQRPVHDRHLPVSA